MPATRGKTIKLEGKDWKLAMTIIQEQGRVRESLLMVNKNELIIQHVVKWREINFSLVVIKRSIIQKTFGFIYYCLPK